MAKEVHKKFKKMIHKLHHGGDSIKKYKLIVNRVLGKLSLEEVSKENREKIKLLFSKTSKKDKGSSKELIKLAKRLLKTRPLQGKHDLEKVLTGAFIMERSGLGSDPVIVKSLIRVYRKHPEYRQALYIEGRIIDTISLAEEKNKRSIILLISGLYVLFGLFFIVNNITGGIPSESFLIGNGVFGTILFILGWIGVYVFFRKKSS